MPSEVRIKRISDRINQDLTKMIITNRIHDPRVNGISITGVDVDRELSYADIYVSALEGSSRSKEVLQGLESASGFIRHELSQKIDLRIFPKLRFHWDPTPEKADHIERVLASIRAESEPKPKTKRSRRSNV